ncbi:sulfatase-like hydrolase/transferase [Nitrospinota bacterium]
MESDSRETSPPRERFFYWGIGLFVVNAVFLQWFLRMYIEHEDEVRFFLWGGNLAIYFVMIFGILSGLFLGFLLRKIFTEFTVPLVFLSLLVFIVFVVGINLLTTLAKTPLVMTLFLGAVFFILPVIVIWKIPSGILTSFASFAGFTFSVYTAYVVLRLLLAHEGSVPIAERTNIPAVRSGKKTDARRKLPDVYILVFDEYGLRVMNKPEDLKKEKDIRKILGMGFDIYENVFANYMMTGISFSSFFQSRHLGDKWSWSKEMKAIRHSNPLYREAMRLGYEVVVYSGHSVVPYCDPLWGDWKCVYPGHRDDAGQFFQGVIALINDVKFLIASTLVQIPVAHRILEKVGFSHAVHMLGQGLESSPVAAFKRLKEDTEKPKKGSRPKFIFAHLVIPHPPFIVDGECVPYRKFLDFLDKDRRNSPEHLFDAYKKQTRCANKMMREFAEILAKKGVLNDSLVIFMADHGSASGGQIFKSAEEWSPTDIRERFSVFFGVKFPQNKKGTIKKKAIQLLDLAPTILNVIGGSVPKKMEGKDFRFYEPAAIRIGLAGPKFAPKSYNNSKISHRNFRVGGK